MEDVFGMIFLGYFLWAAIVYPFDLYNEHFMERECAEQNKVFSCKKIWVPDFKQEENR